MPYRPQLDSLRAIAILIVMVHHFMFEPFVLAGYGVILFFVISGYFATRGLLKSRDHIAEGNAQVADALGLFYSRRYLRIMPIYYLVLLVGVLLNIPYARSSFLANAAFVSNFAMVQAGEWFGAFSHFWSLAVLEQFYLVWPLLILCTPRRFLLALSLGTVLLGPLYRGYCQFFLIENMHWTMMPLGSIDWLGAGALLAVAQHLGCEKRFTRLGVWCGPVVLTFIMLRRYAGWEAPGYALYMPMLAALFYLWLVARARNGMGGRFGWLLDQRWLARIGQMSYSIFLLHSFSELLVPHWGWLDPIMESDLRLFVLIPLTIGLATLSWRFVESPILRLKDRLTASLAERTGVIARRPALG